MFLQTHKKHRTVKQLQITNLWLLYLLLATRCFSELHVIERTYTFVLLCSYYFVYMCRLLCELMPSLSHPS
jgi:hypothetical protein